ncbi:MAG: hypothetical protein ACYSU0_01075 [Planctomycetota bacterium]|jgi:hypothetical protein
MCSKTSRNAVLVTISCLVAGCGAKVERGGGEPEKRAGPASAAKDAPVQRAWKDTFDLDKCTLLTTGRNTYFILQPGYQILLAEEDRTEQVFITVLDETETVDGIETRVVEEREFLNGKLKEVSRNFFTICKEHNDVFYHGEDVDDYKNGKVVGHGGAWRAGVKGARAGLMMQGKIEIGAKYYQEVAPEVAMDRAENVRDDVTVETPAGTFANCLKVIETSPLEPGAESLKVYAPGVGMIVDEDLKLARYGQGKPPAAAAAVAPAEVEPPIGETPPAAAAAPKPKKPAPAPSGKPASEVEIQAGEMPAPVAAVIAKLYPKGRIHEVKREKHKGGQIVYAIEIFIGDQQYDVEAMPDGTVLRNEAEK